jgi:prepilin-type N-terminal cleavage/methylation domain-containing protein
MPDSGFTFSALRALAGLPGGGWLERRRSHGFSLLETLVALTVLAVALLFTLSLLAHEVRIRRQVAAHTAVVDLLETAHEAIRAGWPLPLGATALDWRQLDANAVPPVTDLTISAEVRPLAVPDLYHVILIARYREAAFAQPLERRLETMVWRP